MNCAKIMSVVILMGAMNMSAMNKDEAKSPDKTKTAKIENNKINVRDIKSGAVIATFTTGNRYTWFGSVKFKDDTTVIGNVVAGIDEDHLQATSVEYKLTSQD